MEASGDLKLYGYWISPFVNRVRLALELKGLQYEYVEEDLSNKSPSLLLYNPVHKKVPVLLHDGRPVAESLVILEYIDDTWSDRWPLLPRDPYERAIARFWCHFIANQLDTSSIALLKKTGEELEAATSQFLADLNVVEKELREGFFKGRKFFGGDQMGLLDVVFCGAIRWFPMLEECTGVKLLGSDAFPFLSSLASNLEEQEAVKLVFREKQKMEDAARAVRARLSQASK